MSTEDAQYHGGISSLQWMNTINQDRVGISSINVEYVQYGVGITSVSWKMFSTVVEYHKYSGGCSVQLRDITSKVEEHYRYSGESQDTVQCGKELHFNACLSDQSIENDMFIDGVLQERS